MLLTTRCRNTRMGERHKRQHLPISEKAKITRNHHSHSRHHRKTNEEDGQVNIIILNNDQNEGKQKIQSACDEAEAFLQTAK